MRFANYSLLLAGFSWAIYSFLNLGATALPYPDPTPELLKEQAEQISFWIFSLFAGALAASLGGFSLWKQRRRGSSRDHSRAGTAT
jgi:hypothetical protein